MKKLTKKAARVMDAITEGLERPGDHRKIDNTPGIMAVCIEVIEECGGNLHISVAHYGEQAGDLMRDPEMIFLKVAGDYYPYYFRNDYVGVEQYSVEFERDEVGRVKMMVRPKMQADHAAFANTWMVNIQEQQTAAGGWSHERAFPNQAAYIGFVRQGRFSRADQDLCYLDGHHGAPDGAARHPGGFRNGTTRNGKGRA